MMFIIVGLLLMSCNKLYTHNKLKKDKEMVDAFFKTESLSNKNKANNNYFFVIEIPKIDLKRVVYNIDSSHNNVNENITVLKNSSDIMLLAAHSGNASISYFKNLYKLSKGDSIYLYYYNKTLMYEVVNYYEEAKDGDITILDNTNNKKLILTTCKGINKQLVYISYLKNELSY